MFSISSSLSSIWGRLLSITRSLREKGQKLSLKSVLNLTSDRGLTEIQNGLQWVVDEMIYFRGNLYVAGWAFHSRQPICEMGYIIPGGNYRKLAGYGLASPDVENRFGSPARNCRLAFQLKIDAPESALNMKLVFTLKDGSCIDVDQFANKKLAIDPFHLLEARFYQLLSQIKIGGKVLELGSRNRSGVIRRHLIPNGLHYIGMDILDGDNVDVVGDAHALSKLFEPNTFDAIFATSVFEHLIMPWKVVLEMNHVMKMDGLAMITTHQTWPLHETPWDFWRFSDQSWRGLFNEYTGFTIIETAMGEPASIISHMLHPVTLGLERHPGYLGSAVLCKKIGDTQLSWDVETAKVIDTMYPKEACNIYENGLKNRNRSS